MQAARLSGNGEFRILLVHILPNIMPIMIVQMAGQQAQHGLMNLVFFSAFLSISLGLFNLFPIPVLDGGQVWFLIAEAVRGRPLSRRVQEVTQQIGLVLLLLLMLFAFYNDITRIVTGTKGF